MVEAHERLFPDAAALRGLSADTAAFLLGTTLLKLGRDDMVTAFLAPGNGTAARTLVQRLFAEDHGRWSLRTALADGQRKMEVRGESSMLEFSH